MHEVVVGAQRAAVQVVARARSRAPGAGAHADLVAAGCRIDQRLRVQRLGRGSSGSSSASRDARARARRARSAPRPAVPRSNATAPSSAASVATSSSGSSAARTAKARSSELRSPPRSGRGCQSATQREPRLRRAPRRASGRPARRRIELARAARAARSHLVRPSHVRQLTRPLEERARSTGSSASSAACVEGALRLLGARRARRRARRRGSSHSRARPRDLRRHPALGVGAVGVEVGARRSPRRSRPARCPTSAAR